MAERSHLGPPSPFPSPSPCPSMLPSFRPFPPYPLQQQQQPGCAQEEQESGSIVDEDTSPSSLPSLTLLIKHLPEALSSDTLLRLFSHYGATGVRLCSHGRLKNCAFVDFKDESQAAKAQAQLHRLCFLGKMLCVERARPCPTKKVSEESSSTKVKEHMSLPPQEEQSLLSIGSSAKATAKSFIYKAEPIAPSLGVDYPFAPHLEYAYPPPDGNILTNIVNALIAVPRFYTQVLHLMNKMNLPAPFRAALPTPPLPSVPPPPAPAPPPSQPQDLSSDESELESSEESSPNVVHNVAEGGQISEMGVDEGSSSRKRRREKKRMERFMASATSGAKPTQLIPKEKPIIKKRSTVLQINITSKGLISGGVQDKADVASETFSDSMNDGIVKPRNYATKEELEAGKMPLPEIHALPMFKNYTLGNPSPVLYIKNLAKEVVQDDLYYVFGAMFGNVEETKSKISIKLMQEGRMRGQAFVTFPSEKLAGDALNAVHAYVLKGKPMIVQFGRNPSKPSVDSIM